MPTLIEILETLAWYRPLETIVSDEGIKVIKISNDEIRISYMGITKTAKRINPQQQIPPA